MEVWRAYKIHGESWVGRGFRGLKIIQRSSREHNYSFNLSLNSCSVLEVLRRWCTRHGTQIPIVGNCKLRRKGGMEEEGRRAERKGRGGKVGGRGKTARRGRERERCEN